MNKEALQFIQTMLIVITLLIINRKVKENDERINLLEKKVNLLFSETNHLISLVLQLLHRK